LLESGLNKLDGRILNPWEEALNGVDEKLVKMQNALENAGGSLTNFGRLQESHYVDHLLKTLVADATEGLEVIENSVEGLIDI